MEDIKTNQELQTYEAEVTPYKNRIESLVIADEPRAKYANELLLAIKKRLTSIEEWRKKFVKPIKDHAKMIDNQFAAIAKPYEDMDEVLRRKMLDWQIKEQKRLKEEAQQTTNLESEVFGTESTEAIAPKSNVVSAMGQTFTKKRWVAEVVDEALIPREYLEVNMVKVNAMVKANTRIIKGVTECAITIPGIKIYQKEELAVR